MGFAEARVLDGRDYSNVTTIGTRFFVFFVFVFFEVKVLSFTGLDLLLHLPRHEHSSLSIPIWDLSFSSYGKACLVLRFKLNVIHSDWW